MVSVKGRFVRALVIVKLGFLAQMGAVHLVLILYFVVAMQMLVLVVRDARIKIIVCHFVVKGWIIYVITGLKLYELPKMIEKI